MTKWMRRCAGPLMIVLVGCAFAPPAWAQAQASAAKPLTIDFVGSYTLHGYIHGTRIKHASLTVNADGTTTDQDGNVGSWFHDRGVFILDVIVQGHSFVYRGLHRKHGISSKSEPGSIQLDDSPAGSWWAIRVS